MSTDTLPSRLNGHATPAAPSPAPAPFRVADIQTMAQYIARSRLWGMDEAQAFSLMMLAHAKGLHPIQAVERYHLISGKPAMKADAMLAEFQSRGGVVTWHRHDETACEATFDAPGVGEPVRVSWTVQDAKRAKLANPMWDKYPRQMLRARVISEAIRMVMPGVLSGIYTPEEVADFDDRPPARWVNGRSEPEPAAAEGQPGKTRDDRPFDVLIRDGLRKARETFAEAFPGVEPGLPNEFEAERHMLKAGAAMAGEDVPAGLGQADARKSLARLYAGPHRKALRRELADYLKARLAEASERAADAPAADPEGDGDPDDDLPGEFCEREPGED